MYAFHRLEGNPNQHVINQRLPCWKQGQWGQAELVGTSGVSGDKRGQGGQAGLLGTSRVSGGIWKSLGFWNFSQSFSVLLSTKCKYREDSSFFVIALQYLFNPCYIPRVQAKDWESRNKILSLVLRALCFNCRRETKNDSIMLCLQRSVQSSVSKQKKGTTEIRPGVRDRKVLQKMMPALGFET